MTQNPEEPRSRGTVLVVDDVAANRELLTQDLEEEGFEVKSVASGLDCLSTAKADPPHVILLDIQMAGMDGIETCRRLKADPATADIPVLFVTANRTGDDATLEALKAGGNDFLTKPYSPAILIARVSCQVTIARAHARLRTQAIIDELTGIFSRRHLFHSLRTAVKGISRTPGTVGCLLADVDHFKAYNDTHGHLDGDRALRGIAQTIQASVRETDVVGRYGGEEFAVVLPQTDLDGSAAVAEKIRGAIAARCPPLTISIGAAAISTEDIGDSRDPPSIDGLVEKVLRRADAAAYTAKSAGRNRVEIARAR